MAQIPVPIAGKAFTNADSVEVRSPYTQEVIAEVPACGAAEVNEACKAAAAALERDDFPQHRRAEVLERAAVLLRERSDNFAHTISREAGKPITTARGEVARCVDTLIFSAVEARKLCGEMIPLEASAAAAGKLGFALRVPIGVVGAITPFNFPLNLVAHKLAPAVAAGCPVVLKPAPQTPLSGIALVELLVEAGLPADWISVVTDSGKEAGAPLVAHAIPKMITFTGSAPVGWQIAAAAPKKRVSLELGSNSPVIVEPDADLAKVAEKLKAAGFANAGQSCISVQRLLVHQDVHGAMLELLKEAAESLVTGDPENPATQVGPLIHPRENQRLAEWIQQAVDAGGRVITGNEVRDGVFVPTVVDNVPQTCKLATHEAFGPVVAVFAYHDFDEAIARANDSAFGLHAGIFTSDLGKALKAVRRLDYGGVLINETPTFRADQQPYGGVRDAGNTREGPAYTVREMTELRFVSLQAP
ncbi:MAG: aldehyde dehydrogenase family protein [Gammaproteobacteria bacterium]